MLGVTSKVGLTTSVAVPVGVYAPVVAGRTEKRSPVTASVYVWPGMPVPAEPAALFEVTT